MTGGAVLKAAWAGSARRLVQSVVVFGMLAASSAAALLGLSLLTSANEGFYVTQAATHGAQLAVTINAAKVSAAQLAKTRHLPGVTQAPGPYPQVTITVATGGSAGQRAASGHPSRDTIPPSGQPRAQGGSWESPPGGLPPQQLTVVGRASPSGPLDHIAANPAIMTALTHGRSRWPARPGEISLAMATGIRLPLGSKVTVTSAPGKPKLTIVGYGNQNVTFEDAWVVPSQIPVLRANGAPA